MENLNKILKKLLDNFILPKFEDIIEYKLLSNDNNIFDILFLMDGTEEEIEKEIVSECQNILKYYGIPNTRILYRFTVDGEKYYDYI